MCPGTGSLGCRGRRLGIRSSPFQEAAHPPRKYAVEKGLSEKRGVSIFLERESIRPVDVGLVWRGLCMDELPHGIADVTKLRTGVVPDYISESSAFTAHLTVQHFFDGDGSIGETNESARAYRAKTSARQIKVPLTPGRSRVGRIPSLSGRLAPARMTTARLRAMSICSV
jgi:hypothetical protein